MNGSTNSNSVINVVMTSASVQSQHPAIDYCVLNHSPTTLCAISQFLLFIVIDDDDLAILFESAFAIIKWEMITMQSISSTSSNLRNMKVQ